MKQHTPIKVLTLVQAMSGRLSQDELDRREASDLWPRISLFERTLNSDMLNERFLEHVPAYRKQIYQNMPVHLAQVIEAFLIRNRYDVIISWAENLGLPFAALMKVTGTRKPHIAIFSWISKAKKAMILRYVQSHIDRVVLMSSAQRDYAIDKIGIPEDKIEFLRWPVDLKFWRPLNDVPMDMICSVGREMRDYGTLISVVKEIGIKCHIAAGGLTMGDKKDTWIQQLKGMDGTPSHLTIGKKSYPELRELYARSKFVVIPIYPTDTDNGTTSILEAMAMGKAVICSKTDGQRDVIQDGKNGIFVPPQNHRALYEAIEYLWENPNIAAEMGKEARKFVETHHSLDDYVFKIREIVDEVVVRSRVRMTGRDRVEPVKRKKALTIISGGIGRSSNEEIHRLEANDQSPHILYFEDTINSDILDNNFLNKAPLSRRILYNCLPMTIAQVLEAYRVRKYYDVIVSWSTKNGLAFALLLKLTMTKYPHIALMSWLSNPKKIIFLKCFQSHIDRILVWSSVQQSIAISKIEIPSSKVVLVSRRADTKFWRPMPIETTMVCSVGQEMRDYPTLIKAMEGIDIACHIATGEFYGKHHKSVRYVDRVKHLPPNITIGKLNSVDLRLLYARSRFVIIPLVQSDTDNGVTSIEESMAMGKAVICSRTQGQVDIIQDGETGIYVPVGDPIALREVILFLWNNPKLAEEMGKKGRKYIEQNHSLEIFVRSVNANIDEVLLQKGK
jgi:glycosyltransferase involved in cell wall biosynthesis